MISDLVHLTMSEEPMADAERVREVVKAIGEVRQELTVLPTVIMPRPVGAVGGLRVHYVSTAPPAVLPKLARHLEDRYGCEVVASSGNLSDRRALARDLEASRGLAFDAYLTEIKAAAIDVVTRRGAEEGRPVLYCDNDPVPVDGRASVLDRALLTLAREAIVRFGDAGAKGGLDARSGV